MTQRPPLRNPEADAVPVDSDILALFDLDGTLTRQDSFLDFLIWTFGVRTVVRRVIMNLGHILLYKAGTLGNHVPKERLFRSLFKGMPRTEFAHISRSYSEQRLATLLRPAALDRAAWHRDHGHTLIVITASLEDYVRPWAISDGFSTVLGTKAEVENGCLTGGFGGSNCYGPTKVKRLAAHRRDYQESYIYAYGDSRGDRELLDIADEPFMKCFGRH